MVIFKRNFLCCNLFYLSFFWVFISIFSVWDTFFVFSFQIKFTHKRLAGIGAEQQIVGRLLWPGGSGVISCLLLAPRGKCGQRRHFRHEKFEKFDMNSTSTGIWILVQLPVDVEICQIFHDQNVEIIYTLMGSSIDCQRHVRFDCLRLNDSWLKKNLRDDFDSLFLRFWSFSLCCPDRISRRSPFRSFVLAKYAFPLLYSVPSRVWTPSSPLLCNFCRLRDDFDDEG